MIYDQSPLQPPINNFHRSVRAYAVMKMCTLLGVAGSLGMNLRWLLLSPRFHFGTLLQRVLWSKLSERQHGERAKEGERGGERESEGEREREREKGKPQPPKYKQSSALTRPSFPPSCLNKGISAYQKLLSTPIAFCQTVLTSQSSVLLFYSFHLLSATRGLLRDRLVISWPR